MKEGSFLARVAERVVTSLVMSGILIVGGVIFASLSTGINPLFSAIAVIAGAVGVAVSIVLYMARGTTTPSPQPVWRIEVAEARPPLAVVWSMQRVAKVRLDTDVESFATHSEVFEKGDEIEFEARSFGQEIFHFFVCDQDDFTTNQRRSMNFDRLDGVEFTTYVKKKLTIPETGVWFFMVYTPEGEEDAIVRLTIWKLQYDGPFDWSKPWTIAPEPQIEGLSATVAGLVDTGELNDGQGNSLISKLERAIGSLDQGKVNPAIRQLQAFINQVNSLIDERVLSSEEGGSLIAQADAVVEQLGR